MVAMRRSFSDRANPWWVWRRISNRIERRKLNSLHAETGAFLDRMAVRPHNPGIFAIDEFIGALKASGGWAERHAIYHPLHNEDDSLLNWKGSSYSLVNHGAAITPWGKFSTSGTTYLDTGFQPGISAGGQDNVHMTLQYLGPDTGIDGVASIGNGFTRINPRTATDTAIVRIAANANDTYDNIGAVGIYTVNRVLSTEFTLYKDGSSLGTKARTSAAPTAVSAFLGGLNVSGVLTAGRSSEIGFVSIGLGLTAGKEAAAVAALVRFRARVKGL